MHTKLLLILTLVSFFSIASVQAQITEINGRKVEFKEDGTWEYLDPEDNDKPSDDEITNFKKPELNNPSRFERFDSAKEEQQRRESERTFNQRSSNCSDLVKVDLMPDFSGLQKKSKEVYVIGKNSFFINWTQSNKEGLQLIIQFKEDRCISEKDKISFSFKDISENFTVTNSGMPNCDGLIKINDEKVAEVLNSEQIRAISIQTKEGITTEYITPTTAKNILKITNCIYTPTIPN